MLRLLPVLLLLGACAKERETAPPTLDERCHNVYRTWDDPVAFEEEMIGLAAWLDENGRSDEAWEGLRLTNLTEADVADVTVPADADLADHVGIANAGPSAFPIALHGAAVTEADQVWNDPSSFDQYDRTPIEGDAAAFASGSGYFRSENSVIKRGAFGVTIPYELRKDYRWADLGDGRQGFVARHWIAVPGCSDNGNNCVHQTFGLDVFVEDGDETLRLLTNWLYVVTAADGLLTEDARIGLIAQGNQDLVIAADEELQLRADGG
ncbi:MAG: hypothetical protein EP330_28835 [Deltaproteobacteria bacterium]|nr:MAG: hypothetical protein EP330_28835 [Deltaproteobacteria bacterium]